MSSTNIFIFFAYPMNIYFLKLSIFSKCLQVFAALDTNLTYNNSFFSCRKDLTVFNKHQCVHCLLPVQLEHTIDTNKFSTCTNSLSDFNKQNVQLGIKYAKSKVLMVVSIQRPPFSEVILHEDGTETFTGAIFEFLDAIAKKFRIRMKVFTPADGNWGAITRKGIWNGMIGYIERKEADLGAASFSITLERSKVVDFTTAIHYEPTGILIPAPSENGEKVTILVRPFSPEVWLCLGLTILILVPMLYCLHFVHCIIHKQHGKDLKESDGLTNLFLYVIGSIVQESLVSPTEKTTRLLIGVWWMVTLILANSYVAFMVSLLSIQKLENSINSLEDLASQSKIKWTFRFGSALYNLFKSDTSIGVYKAIGDGVNDQDLVKTDHAGVSKVLEGNYAFIKEKSFLEVALDDDFVLTKKCRMTIAKQEFFKLGLGLAVQKKSPLLKLLNYEISITLSTGLMHKWKSMHWPKNLFCVNAAQYIISTRNGPKKLDPEDIQGSLALWAVGISLAAFCFISEIVIRSLHKAFRIRKKPFPLYPFTK